MPKLGFSRRAPNPFLWLCWWFCRGWIVRRNLHNAYPSRIAIPLRLLFSMSLKVSITLVSLCTESTFLLPIPNSATVLSSEWSKVTPETCFVMAWIWVQEPTLKTYTHNVGLTDNVDHFSVFYHRNPVHSTNKQLYQRIERLTWLHKAEFVSPT